MWAELHLLRPEWLIALPVVLATAVLFARRRLGAGSWEMVVDPHLAPYVLSGSQKGGVDQRWILLGIAGTLGVLALAGPAWERIEQPVFRSEQALVVALDLSRSMDAQDVPPSRLLRARLKILDMLEQRASGQTALVVYSANAFTVTPLTTDTDTVAALVNSLGTDIMPSRGSYPIAAIKKGRALLEQAGVAYGEVLLITDGGSSPAAERVARDLRSAGYTLSVLGVGTTQGAPIPRVTGGFVTDRSGQIAVPRLEETSLRALAAAGGGRFATLSADNRDLDVLLSGEIGASLATDESQATDRWRDEGPWLLLLLLPLAALSFRRGWAFIVLLAVLPLAEPAQASLWDDLWQNKNQQGQKRLEDGDALGAAELFDNGEWQAVSRYRGGEYAASAAQFAASAAQFAEHGDARNLYNLGNALALQGEFETAIDAYEQVLEMDPNDVDAEYNRDLLQELLQEQQQQQQEGESQESSQESGGEGEESDSEDQSEQQNADGSSQSESEEGDPSQRPEDEGAQDDLKALQEELQRAAEQADQKSETEQQLSEEQLEELRRAQEQTQAMEQWLRRIPNDPGGLLRRKFRYQYQRLGKDQDGNNLWPDDEVQPW